MRQKEVLEALVRLVFRKVFILLLFFLPIISFANKRFDSKSLGSVESYLNGIKYLEANFIQDDTATSQLSEGKFYLSRPGKLRVDYLNPFEASLYTYNKTTTYYDRELEELTTVRTASTPLQFLLRKNISFASKSFSIIDLVEDDSNISISFIENGKESNGTLVLKFKKHPITLSSLTLINESGDRIEMLLFNISTDPLDDSVFVFKKS